MASNNNIVDLKWMSKGGLLIDSSGDIAFTDNSAESLEDMVVTRLKAAIDSWKLYRIGAGLDTVVGETISDELEITIQKQVTRALTDQFLPVGSFTVETIQVGNTVTVYVYIQGKLIATTSVSVD